MNESFSLAESYLKEKVEMEKEYKEISKILDSSIKNGTKLSKLEKSIISKDILSPICLKSKEDKLKYGSVHGSHPKGNEKFMKKIAKNQYVSEARRKTNRQSEEGNKIRKLALENGGFKFEIIYFLGHGLCIEVSTTAKTELQRDFLYLLLKKELKIKN